MRLRLRALLTALLLGNAAGEARRFQAVRILEQSAAAVGRSLEVSLTMPVTTIGLSLILMNGHMDQPSELFTPATFTTLLGYASRHHLARLSFWSLNRDRACTGNVGWVDGRCSSVTRQPFDFAKVISRFTG